MDDPKQPKPEALVPVQPAELAPFIATPEQHELLSELLKDSMAANTKRSYRAGFAAWAAWARQQEIPILPRDASAAQAIGTWIAVQEQAGAAVSTIAQRIAALSLAYKAAGIDPAPTASFTVKEALKALRRRHVGEEEEAAPIDWALLCRMLEWTPARTRTRDRALLLVGWSGALRRSELAGLMRDELNFGPPGPDGVPAWLRIRFRRATKGDQDKAAEVPIQANDAEPLHCPVRALRSWLASDAHTFDERHGLAPIFRLTADAINDLVKRYARGVGEDPTDYSAHSLRAGFVTEAFRRRIPIDRIQAVTRHKDPKTLMKYRREADPVAGSAAADIWKK